MYRTSRIVVVSGLVLGAIALGVLIGWSIHTRQNWSWGDRSASESLIVRGLRIASTWKYFTEACVIAGASAAGALALAFTAWRHQRWGFLVTSISCALAIAAPWILRAYVWRIEARAASSGAWADRSPYVAAATQLSVAVTCVLAILTVAAAVAWRKHPSRSA